MSIYIRILRDEFYCFKYDNIDFMKTSRLFFLLLITLLFTGCEKKDFYDPNWGNKPPMVDFVIPKTFDWKMSKEVNFVTSSKVSSKITVATDKEFKNIVSYLSTTGSDKDTTRISISDASPILYVKYEKIDMSLGIAECPVSNKDEISVANFVLPNDANPNVTDNSLPVLDESKSKSRLNIRTKDDDDDDGGWWGGMIPNWNYYPTQSNSAYCYFPSANQTGTILFEDEFPRFGDYDFNDVVLDYQMILGYYKGTFNTWTGYIKDPVYAVQVRLSVRALGGLRLSHIYMKMYNVLLSNLYKFETDKPNLVVANQQHLSDGFLVADMSKMTADHYKNLTPSNLYYLNTEPGKITNDLKSVTFNIYLRNYVPLAKFSINSFDFFIHEPRELNEVHSQGYKTIIQYQNYPKLEWLDPNCTYRTKTGYVWGLNIPTKIKHTIEHWNFNYGYPEFRQWVESGGKTNKDWYNRPNTQYLINM